MATWPEVQQYLHSNFKQNLGMQAVAGGDAFAAEIDVEGGSEVVMVFNGGPILQFVVFINSSKPINLELLLTSTQYFGIRRTGDGPYTLQHISWMETVDAPEINLPLNLMASEARRLKTLLGID